LTTTLSGRFYPLRVKDSIGLQAGDDESNIMDVVLHLPDDVYDQAARLARLMNQDVSRVLTETIESALLPLGASLNDLTPVEQLSNHDLLMAAELRMDEAQGKRLGRLLDRQQAGHLSEPERRDLAALMQVYHQCLVRKAQALSEAVRRGLRERLAP
jgi:hypothetical protein